MSSDNGPSELIVSQIFSGLLVDDGGDANADLAKINQRWSEFYKGCGRAVIGVDLPGATRVRFADSDCWQVVEEDPSQAADLAAARRSDQQRKRADLTRAERLLAPILDSRHRERAYSRLHAAHDEVPALRKEAVKAPQTPAISGLGNLSPGQRCASALCFASYRETAGPGTKGALLAQQPEPENNNNNRTGRSEI